MNQTITIKVKLNPTNEQIKLIDNGSLDYIKTINELVSEMVIDKKTTNKTSASVITPLNSAVKNQAIKDAKSVFKKAKKSKYKIIPVLKKPVIVWNNQNYTIKGNNISMPFIIDGKSKKIEIKADLNNDIFDTLSNAKLGTLRVTKKGRKYIAQISITLNIEPKTNGQVMGVDLGILIPAVATTQNGKVKFFGNGRQNKYYRRYYKTKRAKLSKAKKLNAIINMNNKEQRYMHNQDHKISRDIVNFAKENNVSVIRLECLEGISKTTRTSRKNKKNLHDWSFYRLSIYIEYKANLEGIRVEYVNPKYTSQTCPKCGERHKANGRSYFCKDCGFRTHRDLVGAKNIINATVIDGRSLSA
ncbi:RNA-guided endonuclease InsQ/TnpB family protein [Romboutsia lituseburensis]|uniref:RNA-guided endonuclease InsQ/TnpB family protein n=1 Tax=Romboutsia lituseburensis TaxID=1537 RepID=UPI0022EA62D5|nr:transposase [Romboutsia lituseburensis]